MSTIEEARAYVGTDRGSGLLQFALLRLEGLHPGSFVLEIGCGALHVARPVLAFCEPHHYFGVDPNEWLRDVAREADPELDRLCEWARFSSGQDFPAFGERFDFVFAHSVLSHAAEWQLPQFLAAAGGALRPGGKILASLRIGEDSDADAWAYPGVTYFSRRTIKRESRAAGLSVAFRPEHRLFYAAGRPDECHDWVVFSK